MFKPVYILRSVLLVLLALSSGAIHASVGDLNDDSLRQIARITRAISVVNAHLPDGKYLEYGLYIYRAALRYRVEPAVLISIAEQETSFRNDLPEGKAGELGICQIRKMWLKQPRFRAEFHHQTIRDLLTPAKNFLFAAWILKELKEQPTARHTLPYWSYYNSVRFENRFKYFLAVNHYISALRKHEDFFSERAVAAQPVDAANVYDLAPRAHYHGAYRSPLSRGANVVARWSPTSMGETGFSNRRKQQQKWIPDALLKLERAQVDRQVQLLTGAQTPPGQFLAKAKLQD